MTGSDVVYDGGESDGGPAQSNKLTGRLYNFIAHNDECLSTTVQT
jgi:hypothetical protein